MKKEIRSSLQFFDEANTETPSQLLVTGHSDYVPLALKETESLSESYHLKDNV